MKNVQKNISNCYDVGIGILTSIDYQIYERVWIGIDDIIDTNMKIRILHNINKAEDDIFLGPELKSCLINLYNGFHDTCENSCEYDHAYWLWNQLDDLFIDNIMLIIKEELNS